MSLTPTNTPEYFVSATEGAKFLGINPRTLMKMARLGSVPAHPLANGTRKTWRFLLSELAAWLRGRTNPGSGEGERE